MDPASLVGTIAIAINGFQALTNYINTAAGAGVETRDIINDAEVTTIVLQDLGRSVKAGKFHPDSYPSLSRSVASCKNICDDLHSHMERYTVDTHSKSKSFLRTLRWPGRQSGIKDLRQRLLDAKATLVTSILLSNRFVEPDALKWLLIFVELYFRPARGAWVCHQS